MILELGCDVGGPKGDLFARMYLKSIKRLLTEYPTAHFDGRGNLVCEDWVSGLIAPEHLHYFGGRFEDAVEMFYVDECWVEETYYA